MVFEGIVNCVARSTAATYDGHHLPISHDRVPPVGRTADGDFLQKATHVVSGLSAGTVVDLLVVLSARAVRQFRTLGGSVDDSRQVVTGPGDGLASPAGHVSICVVAVHGAPDGSHRV